MRKKKLIKIKTNSDQKMKVKKNRQYYSCRIYRVISIIIINKIKIFYLKTQTNSNLN
jgi:hypothetical protein